MKEEVIVLGIDPGTLITGYGVVQASGTGYRPLDFGAIKPPKTLPFEKRYLHIFNGIETLINKFQPDALSVETQFVSKNPNSALKLGMARGAAILAAARRDIPVFEYAPTKAKLSVVGTGKASKIQVQKMIQMLLNLDKVPEPEDAADALALAICHIHNKRHLERSYA